MIFDETAFNRFQKNAFQKKNNEKHFLLEWALDELKERLSFIKKPFEIVSCWSHGAESVYKILLSQNIGTQYKTKDFFSKNSINLFISLFGLHPKNDLIGLLNNIHIALKKDGLFLAVVPALDTLKELKYSLTQAEEELYGGTSPRVHPFISLQKAGDLMQNAGFVLPVLDVETLTVSYKDLYHLMDDLRFMGMQNVLHQRSKKMTSRRFFDHAAKIYAKKFSTPEKGIYATFSFIWLSGWTKSDAYVPPLAPGSAQKSLKEVLKELQIEA